MSSIDDSMGDPTDDTTDGDHERETWTDAEGDSVEVMTRMIPVDDIEPNPQQTREEFDDDALQLLADDIADSGLINAITLRPHPEKDDKYQIKTGERRWRAVKRNDSERIRAEVEETSDKEILEENVRENRHRTDVEAVPEAKGVYQILIENGVALNIEEMEEAAVTLRDIEDSRASWDRTRFLPRGRSEGLTEDEFRQAVRRTGVPPHSLGKVLRVLAAGDDIQEVERDKSADEKLPRSTLSRIGSIDDEDTKESVYTTVSEQDMTSKETSKFVTGAKKASEETIAFLDESDDEPDIDALNQVVDVISDDSGELQQRVYEKADAQGMDADDAETFAIAVSEADESTQDMWLDSDVDVDVGAIAPVVERGSELSDEQRAAVRERFERIQSEHEERTSTPEAEHREAIATNAQAHSGMNESLGNAECPVCGNGPEHLQWECHGF